MALGTENSRRFFGGGNSGTKFLLEVFQKLPHFVVQSIELACAVTQKARAWLLPVAVVLWL
jgi:hypothetical protein